MSSQNTFRWLSVVGARPQFIKLATVCRAIDKHNSQSRLRIEHLIVHTGQHYDADMTDTFFEQLKIPQPGWNLAVHSGSFASQLGTMLQRLEPVIAAQTPSWVLVYGDTNSTLAGALVAARLTIPLAHIEAGCRSYRAGMPEEQNRLVSDHLSRLLLAPSQRAVENLRQEGIGTTNDPFSRHVVWVGDTMLDALLTITGVCAEKAESTLQALGLKKGQFYLLTMHRAENTDAPDTLARVLNALRTTTLPVVFPIHPRTRKLLPSISALRSSSSVRIIPPVSYMEMLILESQARAILTDSGGVQKEALYAQVPCLTLREETEWPETVDAGANRLVGTSRDRILAAIHDPFPSLRDAPKPFGNGHSGENIVREILAASAGIVPFTNAPILCTSAVS